ncbi:hypothetical protein CAPTEDRAFT_216361, partial [Capitella teleta]
KAVKKKGGKVHINWDDQTVSLFPQKKIRSLVQEERFRNIQNEFLEASHMRRARLHVDFTEIVSKCLERSCQSMTAILPATWNTSLPSRKEIGVLRHTNTNMEPEMNYYCLVISPLKALIADQVKAFRDQRLSCVGLLPKEEVPDGDLEGFCQGKYNPIISSPEALLEDGQCRRVTATHPQTPLCWSCSWSHTTDRSKHDIIKALTEETNRYVTSRITRHPDPNWKEVSIEEMTAFLGIRTYMSVLQLPTCDMYWSTDALYGNLFIPKVMKRDRFDKISQYLHVNDVSNNPRRCQPRHDKLAHVRPLLEHLTNFHTDEYATAPTLLDGLVYSSQCEDGMDLGRGQRKRTRNKRRGPDEDSNDEEASPESESDESTDGQLPMTPYPEEDDNLLKKHMTKEIVTLKTKKLANIGGKDGMDCTRHILASIFTNTLATQ